MIIKLILFLFFILPANATIVPECPNDINQELRKRILKLLEDDKDGILGLQFHITTLKMAIKSKEAGHRTLESYVRMEENRLAASDITQEMVEIYKEYGVADDIEEARKLANTSDAKYNLGST